MPVAEMLEYFSYDPETGVITRKKKASIRTNVGDVAGSLNKTTGYMEMGFKRKYYRLHRVAWALHYGSDPVQFIDHINGDKSDNRIANLRLATKSSNAWNQRRPQRSNPYLGVCWHKSSKKWAAQIGLNGKRWCIGLFETAEQARDAYLSEKQKIHGISL